MKKLLIAAVLSLFALTACSNVKDFLLTDITADNSDEEDITFTQDDFALYTAGDDGSGIIIAGLGMKESEIDCDDAELESYLNGFNIEYRDESDPMHTYVDSSGKPVDMTRVSFISYNGGRKPVMTVKGITTTGLINPDTSLCSSVQDVIDRYGIDTENEKYMTPSPSDSNQYTVELYFKAHFDEEEKQAEIREQEKKQQQEKENYNEEDAVISSRVKSYDRVVLSEGRVPADEEVDYQIRFVISNDKVIDIQLYSF